jgi:hypothetical protein
MEQMMTQDLTDFEILDDFKNHPVSGQIDAVFKTVIKEKKVMEKKQPSASADPGEISLGEIGELDIGLSETGDVLPSSPVDEGMDLSLPEEASFDLGDPVIVEGDEPVSQYGDMDLEEEGISLEENDQASEEALEELSLSEESPGEEEISLEENNPELVASDEIENLGDIGLESGDAPPLPSSDFSLDGMDDLSLAGDEDGLHLTGASDELSLSGGEPQQADLSDDAMEKLKEIDAILEFDASQVDIKPLDLKAEGTSDNVARSSKVKDPEPMPNLDEPLVSEDLDLESLDFSGEEVIVEDVKPAAPPKEEKKKKKEVEEVKAPAAPAIREKELGTELREISVAYSGEMERMQATISNLRADREELMAKIQKLEEDKLLQSRQGLTMRAELDERKIELTIIRKKLNEEITELKDRLKLYDEKRLIIEEKNRILSQELDKAAQKNKIDLKKVQMRERELEQRLELLKSDAETQIRNRDLKILELKRKIDAMEFDMESISQQEKRSVESRFELEDKLEKAIKTLRSAITVLEDETDRSAALNALKKNIDM